MESCTSIVNDNVLLNRNNKSDISGNSNLESEQIQNHSTQVEDNRSDNPIKESINSSSSVSLFSENELKEIENAYQITDSHQLGKIRRIDPSRFLHSLPDGAYPQLPRIKKYTTVYTSNILFPLNETNINSSSDINSNKDNNKIIINSNNEDSLSHICNNRLDNNESCKHLVNDLKNTNKDVKKDNTKLRNTELENNDTKIEIDETYKNLMPKFTDMVKVKKINFPMIMDILNGKRTSTLYERHASVIEKLIKIIKESMVSIF